MMGIFGAGEYMGHYFSYLRATFRLWRRHFVGVFIAFAGLAAAFAVALLVSFYVYDGIRSDAWLEGVESLYRINERFEVDGKPGPMSTAGAAHPSVAVLARDNLAEVTGSLRIKNIDASIQLGDKSFAATLTFADPSLADLMPLPVLEGDLKTALADPGTLALTERDAERFFGPGPKLGQTLTVVAGEATLSFKVGAVLRNLPSNTHLDIGLITLWNDNLLRDFDQMIDFWPGVTSYVRLAPGSDTPTFRTRFAEAAGAQLSPVNDIRFIPEFEPVLGLQYNSTAYGQMKPGTNKGLLNILAVLALVLLAVAAFNAGSLFSAVNMVRLKEVAVRRTVGAARSQLATACLLEGGFTGLLAYGFAVLLAGDMAPLMEDIVHTDLPVFTADRLPLLLAGGLLAVLVGVIGAVWLAFRVIRLGPERVLRSAAGSVVSGRGRGRSILVALQAVAVVGTLIATAQIAWQIHWFLNKDRGYEEQGLVFIKAPAREKRDLFAGSFLESVRSAPGITAATVTGHSPFGDSMIFLTALKRADRPEKQQVVLRKVGPDYLRLLKIKPLAELQEDWYGQPNMVALSQDAVKAFGFDSNEAALGALLADEFWGDQEGKGAPGYRVVAVLDELDDANMRGNLPEIYDFTPAPAQFMSDIMLLTEGDAQAVEAAILSAWHASFPDEDAQIEYLTDRLWQNQRKKVEVGRACAVVAICCVLMCFAGLYGMASHWATTRRRELALRRVLGANGRALTRLFLKKMLTPVAIGGVLALVPSWYMSKRLIQILGDTPHYLPLWLYGLVLMFVLLLAALMLIGHIRQVLAVRPASVLHYE